jgi:biofilm PGA synthesis N-glycosyltransferase PgaC
MDWAKAVFAGSAALFLYPTVLYPLAGVLFGRRRRRVAPEPEQWPSLAMVVCALNERNIIRQKVENTLALDYPRDRLRLIFVSDGSTDGTTEILEEFAGRGIELIARPQRMGKISNLNEVVPRIAEEITVLSDANVLYNRDALKALAAPFADPSVGAVSGKVILQETTGDLEAGEQQYYSVEWKLQELASAIYSMAGADGAMYAFRTRLFQRCPPDTLIEDFVIPISFVRQGKRVLHQPAAIGWERGPESLGEEFRRRVRIAAGAAQALLRGNGWPVGAPLRFWFVWSSHKFLRWVSPLTGLAALAAAVAVRGWLPGQIALWGFAAAALLALVRAITGWQARVLDVPFYFLFGQCAHLIGLVKGAAGRQSVLWEKASR